MILTVIITMLIIDLRPVAGSNILLHFQVRNNTGQAYKYCSIFKNGTTEVAMAQSNYSSNRY
jgi:hypothetical protein